LAEALLKYTLAALLNERQEDLVFFDERIEKGLVIKLEGIVGSEFVHMDYGEAIQVLERTNEKFEFPAKWGIDLQSEQERYLTEKYAKKPVIVMNYPKVIKAFYMRVNDNGRTVAAMDVLAPGIGEIIGGSQREERLEVLDRSMAERRIDQDEYAWYRDLRRYGHGAACRLRPHPRQRPRCHPLPAHARQRAVLTLPSRISAQQA
jgi:asparaginyl-tRNA synthetase